MNTSEKGDASEAAVISKLKLIGIEVSIPFGDSARYDIIIDDGSELLRTQVKTATERKSSDTITFNCYTDSYKNGGERNTKSYTPDEIDGYAVYSPSLDECYWVPVEDSPSSKMTLRYSGDMSHHRTNNASNYLLTERFK